MPKHQSPQKSDLVLVPIFMTISCNSVCVSPIFEIFDFGNEITKAGYVGPVKKISKKILYGRKKKKLSQIFPHIKNGEADKYQLKISLLPHKLSQHMLVRF